mmetsp:Transcript_2993/g.10795  ORF Transcript_2993/g.10795 Transcript_2993/m.10795 type:complete len:145 (-) Transcript_2993:93-527(-)
MAQQAPEEEQLVPQDGKVVLAILKSMGVEEVDSRVVPQFLEFIFRYTSDILEEAQVYAEHAGRPDIQFEDIKLAIQCRVNFSFTQPPPREVQIELAQQRNSRPLPALQQKFGLPLPRDEYTLLRPGYKVQGAAETRDGPVGMEQ